MTKIQFILALQEKLKGMSKEDLHRSLEYYNEMIDDRIEEGLSEEEAVADVGSVEEIAQQILEETPMAKLKKEAIRLKEKAEPWQIVLLIVSAPIWLSLLFGLASGLFGLYIGIWSGIIALYAVGGALIVSGIGCVFGTLVVLFTGSHISALAILSCGLICGGIGIFMIIGGKYAVKCTIWITKKVWQWVKSLFVRKEAAQ